jgi:hypothetical protein
MIDTAVTCISCAATFSLDAIEQKLLTKFTAPPPKLCPQCRQQRRLAYINQLNLFKRRCDATGASIVSNYPAETAAPVYAQKYWYSDGWDPKSYGMIYDPSKSFFEQFATLQQRVPRPALFTDYLRDENCAYTNYAAYNKNCYLIFQSGYAEDSYYSYRIEQAKKVVDARQVHHSELCYELYDCGNCYSCAFLSNSEGCRDSYFLDGCIGCTRCISCVNLRHKDLHIDNKPVSKDEFNSVRALIATRTGQKVLAQKHRALMQQALVPAVYMTRCENVTGDYLKETKNAAWCFDTHGLEDGAFCTQCFSPLRDALDCDGCGEGELLYESHQSGMRGYNLRWTLQCIEQVRDLTYCDTCMQSNDLFGCVGLRRSSYCILNTSYSREVYHALVAQITQDMIARGEWGMFFPLQSSPVPYNLSMAQASYPLTAEEATMRGLRWYQMAPSQIAALPASEIPDDITSVQDTITKQPYLCTSCNHPFKFIPQEIALYRELVIAPPERCFSCRHAARVSQRNSRKLRHATCPHCQQTMLTGADASRYKEILCEACFTRACS